MTVSFTVHSDAATWNDVNGNFAQDTGETRRSWELAAAVTRPAVAAASSPADDQQKDKDKLSDKSKLSESDKDKLSDKDKDKDKKADKKDRVEEGRALVVADSDVLGDALIRSYGNPAFVIDGMKWLLGEEAITGEVSSEVDVPIAHTRKEDVWWFYSSTFLVPGLVLGVGALATRRRRGARRRAVATVGDVAAKGAAS